MINIKSPEQLEQLYQASIEARDAWFKGNEVSISLDKLEELITQHAELSNLIEE